MTRADIEKMDAGPEMDALVAERVMGWRRGEMNAHVWYAGPVGQYNGHVHEANWRPSSDMAAAWEVVERLCDGMSEAIWAASRRHGWAGQEHAWRVGFYGPKRAVEATGPTAPLAIARAALLAAAGE